jgi:hypothetical protein
MGLCLSRSALAAHSTLPAAGEAQKIPIGRSGLGQIGFRSYGAERATPEHRDPGTSFLFISPRAEISGISGILDATGLPGEVPCPDR